MARRRNLAESELDAEIKRLQQTEAVKLALKERAYHERRRQYLYSLRALEKRGLQLMEEGFTRENFRERMEAMERGEEPEDEAW